jgi:hypothetical protein
MIVDLVLQTRVTAGISGLLPLQACATADVTDNERPRPSATAEHACVIFAEFKRLLS